MIVVEVLGRRGEVLQRARLERMPATIGRDWSNDVVVADPMVDARHAQIVADEAGGIAIEDLGSLNGLHAGTAKDRVPRVVLNGVTMVRVGRTALRIARADQPVPPAIPDLAPSGRLAWLLASPGAMAVVMGGVVALLLCTTWLASFEAKAAEKIAGEVLGFVAVIAGWAGIWSLVGRIRVQQFLYWQHTTVAALAVVAFMVVGELGSWLDFLFPASGVAGLEALAEVVIAVTVMTIHLGLVGGAARGRRVAIATGITVSLLVMFLLTEKATRNEFASTTVSIGSTLEPLPASLVPSKGVDDLVRGSDALKREVDALQD